MRTALDMVLAQGVPLSPSLQTRLIALLLVEAFLITTAALLYILWARLKKQPLDEWWAGREAEGFSPRVRALMEESERERIAAEDAAPPQAERPVAGPSPETHEENRVT
jgi:hypothetical protein